MDPARDEAWLQVLALYTTYDHRDELLSYHGIQIAQTPFELHTIPGFRRTKGREKMCQNM